MLQLPTHCPACHADGELAVNPDLGALVCEACGADVSDLIPRRPSMNGHGADTEPPRQLRTRALELDKLRPVEWLWERWLVRGVLNLLTGEEGVGKSVLLSWIIARATHGELPGAFHGTPVRVLWVGDEDSWERVVGPRLYAASADLALVHELTMGDESALLDIVRDAPALDALLAREAFQLVAFEALADNLPPLRNPTDVVEVRRALRPLLRVAARHETTVLGTLHTTKVETGEFRRKQGLSHQFNARARAAVFLGYHPDGSGLRAVARGKGNYGPPPVPLTFGINALDFELNGHRFSEPVTAALSESPDLTLEELVRGPHRSEAPGAPKRDALREPLLAALTRRPQGERTLADRLGASRSTTRDALLRLQRDGLAESTPRGWLVGRSYRGEQPTTQEATVSQLFSDEDTDPEETDE